MFILVLIPFPVYPVFFGTVTLQHFNAPCTFPSVDVGRIFAKPPMPQKVNKIKESGSKPEAGTGKQTQALNGNTAALSVNIKH